MKGGDNPGHIDDLTNMKANTLKYFNELTRNMSNQFQLYHIKLENYWLKFGKKSRSYYICTIYIVEDLGLSYCFQPVIDNRVRSTNCRDDLLNALMYLQTQVHFQ